MRAIHAQGEGHQESWWEGGPSKGKGWPDSCTEKRKVGTLHPSSRSYSQTCHVGIRLITLSALEAQLKGYFDPSASTKQPL